MNREDKVFAFKGSCKLYKSEKETVMFMNPNTDPIYYQYLDEDVSMVEKTFQKIKEECGTNAQIMFWLLYVEGESQVEVAKKFGITRRSLQCSVYKWLDRIFQDDKE